MNFKLVTPFLFLFLLCVSAQAQDQIILKSAEELKGKVTEVKLDRIIYKDEKNPDGPTIELNKEDVFLIIDENGTTYKPNENSKEESTNKSSGPKRFVDTLAMHVMSGFISIPEIRDIRNIGVAIGTSVGFSWEYLSKKRVFGLKVSPHFNLYGFGINPLYVAFMLPISPRVYLVSKPYGQFYLGIEGNIGTHFNAGNPGFIGSGYQVIGCNLYSKKSRFVFTLETGVGYEYRQRPFYNTTSYDNNLSSFMRFGFGSQIKRKR